MLRLILSAIIAASLTNSVVAQDRTPAAKQEPAEQSEPGKNAARSNENDTGSSSQGSTQDGNWSGSCVQQGTGGAPSTTAGTTDGSGTTINNC